jgi:hypothetical protein
MGAVITTAVEYQQPISNSISQSPCSLSSGSPLTTSCSTSSSHSKHHTTRTISGGNTAETMTIQPGSFDATLIIEENVSKDIEYIEVLVSTRYNSAGGSHATIIDPNAGDQGTQTPSASPTLGSGSMNAYGMHENGNSKEDGNGKGRSSSTLVTTTKSKIHPTGSTHY